ncbi:SPOR domain-containing protein [Pedobacter sp. AW1-32]|uniref:HU domain-containing protein n=1 Tax=Pedobacter sp. AW1-32 TaxID=3383026 RepID=UPI003FEF1C66
MDILAYALEFLQQRKTVAVKGLGAFHKKKFPGRYDKETKSFLPPGYTLQFSAEAREDDGLIDFIVEKRNVSKETATYFVTQFVEATHEMLETEHEVEYEDFGRLFFTEHEGLSFEPAQNITYGSEFYGFPAVKDLVFLPEKPANDELKHTEVAEAPSHFLNNETTQDVAQQPEIETIELDEVRDDLTKTLGNPEQKSNNMDENSSKPEKTVEPDEEGNMQSEETVDETPQADLQEGVVETVSGPESIVEENEVHSGDEPESELPKTYHQLEEQNIEEVTEAPDFIQEQHAEHPNRFGHTPEPEEKRTVVNRDDFRLSDEKVTESPAFIQQQHAEHPHRFGHRPEPEERRTIVNRDELVEDEHLTQSPAFIKKQHAEHPNRFGHDPMLDEPAETEKKSVWPKIFIAIGLLLVIGAIIFLVKPDLFKRSDIEDIPEMGAMQTPVEKEDPLKLKLDSIAKTDSILKANQVQKTKAPIQDTVKTSVNVSKTDAPKQYDIIIASYKFEKDAQEHIAKLKLKGIDAHIARISGLRKSIGIGPYTDQNEALKQMEILQKKFKGKGYYVKQINTP